MVRGRALGTAAELAHIEEALEREGPRASEDLDAQAHGAGEPEEVKRLINLLRRPTRSARSDWCRCRASAVVAVALM